MMKDEEYELVPVNPIKKLERKVKELESRGPVSVPIEELGKNIDKLNEQVSKLVTVNINLQAKITELLIKTAEQIEQVTEMIELLKHASEVDVNDNNNIDLSPIINELKKISAQNEEVKNNISELTNLMRNTYRKEKIAQVIKGGNNA